MRLHIIMHEAFEAPGAILQWANQKNHTVTYTKLYENQKFPTTDSFDFLFVMGGPQSPATTTEECPHFDAQKEIQFIKKTIDADRPVLGICLGAQLIGEALGAKFDHSPNREIGVFDLKLTPEAKEDPIFSTFPETFPVGHWHGDMPGLTTDTKILATSEGCPRQIVRYTQKVYGFQCHFEFTPEAIEGMIENCSHELEEYKDLPYIQQAEVLRAQECESFNKLLFRFLDYMEEQETQ